MSGYGDIEETLRDWIDARTPANVTVVVEPADGLPRDLVYDVPLVAVTKVGGVDPILSLDDSVVDLMVYASTYDYARRLASDLHVAVRRDLPGHRDGPLQVTRARTVTSPRKLPWAATNVILVGATYELRCKARIGAT